MKRYDTVEWILYKKEMLHEHIKTEMEDHLLECDSCMDLFLSLISEKDINNAGELISDDFNENLMKDIVKAIPLNKHISNKVKEKNKKKTKIYNEILLYYTAVASVAIFLTATGFFNRVVEKVPEISSNIHHEKLSINTYKINEFSKSITKATANFTNSIKFNKGEN